MQKEINSLEDQIETIFQNNTNVEEELLEKDDSKELPKMSIVDRLFNKLEDKKLINKYVQTVMTIKKEQGYLNQKDEDQDTTFFVRIGLLEFDKSQGQWKGYKLSKNGEEVLIKAQLEIE
jgi:hypothetical protein